jgi:hypothetical protein
VNLLIAQTVNTKLRVESLLMIDGECSLVGIGIVNLNG